MNPAVQQFRRKPNWKDALVLLLGLVLGPLFVGALIGSVFLLEEPIRLYQMRHGEDYMRAAMINSVKFMSSPNSRYVNTLREIAEDRTDDASVRAEAIDALLVATNDTEWADKLLQRPHQKELRKRFLFSTHFPATTWHCDFYLRELQTAEDELRKNAILGYAWNSMKCFDFVEALRLTVKNENDPAFPEAVYALAREFPGDLTTRHWIAAFERADRDCARFLIVTIKDAPPPVTDELVNALVALSMPLDDFAPEAVDALAKLNRWTPDAQQFLLKCFDSKSPGPYDVFPHLNQRLIRNAAAIPEPLPELVQRIKTLALDSTARQEERAEAIRFVKHRIPESEWDVLREQLGKETLPEIQRALLPAGKSNEE